ncbi:uncharacterized protein LOC110856516 isoform X1 [Folsomia candida]|nr:uncharacterized protein LOC110856516 isoform X1 [Folsomia candida]
MREFEKEEKKREAAKKMKAQEEEFNQQKKKVSASPQKPTNKIKPQQSSSYTSFKTPEAEVRQEIQGLAIEFGFSKVRVGRVVKNKVEIVPNPWGEEWTPTILSVTEENEIQIGEETITNQNKIRIAETITSPGSQIFKLLLHGKYQVVAPEVVIALFLSRIKTDVEKNIGGSWTRTVISVPLCLTSTQRQGMKNAAKLAGFEEIRLINDTSAAALCFQEMRDHSVDTCVLVGVVHNFDYYFDAALYGWCRIHGSNMEMEMIGSCGNLHSTGSPKPGLFESVKIGLTNVMRALTGKQADELRSIFKDMFGMNKDNITASICINYGTSTEIENLIRHYGRTTENVSISVLGGAAILAERLSKCSENAPLSTYYIKERATYRFERNSLIPGKTNMPRIFEAYNSIVGATIFDDHTIGSLSEGQQKIVIWETSQNLRHHVGTIVVEGTDCSTFNPRPPEYRVKFSLSNEGIFSIDKVYYKYLAQEHTIQYEWKTPLIPESDLVKSKSFVESMAKDEKRELLEKTKNELSVITDKIKEGMYKVEGRMIAEKLLREGISEAETMLSHPKTTQEMLNKKLIVLSRLQEKYLSN